MAPTLVYRCPGPHSRPGGTYAYLPVASEDALAKALAAGWFRSLPEAVAGKHDEPEAAEVPEDDAPPTRAELEQRAGELGIKVDGRWSDARLGAEIAKRS